MASLAGYTDMSLPEATDWFQHAGTGADAVPISMS